MLDNKFLTEVTIYDPIDSSLSLSEHYFMYPNHPWNKWKLIGRTDIATYTDYNKSEDVFQYVWINNRYKQHRVGAPAVIHCRENIFIKEVRLENWYINYLLHRVDGPAVRYNDSSNFWYLFGFELSIEQHEEIVSFYHELGDWNLSFSLSSFEEFTTEEIKSNIRIIERKI